MIPTVASGGIELAVSDQRSDIAGLVFFVHATGFCKETWEPVTGHLAGLPAIAIDQRGHGDSTVGEPPFDWWDLGHDVLAVLDAFPSTRPTIGVGHSSGAAALAMAEVLRPGAFDHLVLIEPITFPGPYGPGDDHPLARGARKRQATFTSLDEAEQRFRGRGPFSRWTDEALSAYLRFGTVPTADGGRRLACQPDTEAEFYRAATTHAAWERLPEIACPVTLVIGQDSDSHPLDFVEQLAARFQNCQTTVVAGATHFVPMEKPTEVARLIASAYESASRAS
ncbi:MAG TPA: alpha/beta hydrolase [Acidimicrobiia bacterium]|nr:alpha/beta hydrolase [Acidimicrobiia bacterium]